MKLTQQELEMLDESTRQAFIEQQEELDRLAQQAKEYEMLKQRFSQQYMNPAKRDLYKVLLNEIDPNLAKDLPQKLPIDDIINPLQEKMKEIDILKHQMESEKLTQKIFATASKYGIPDTPEITQDIKNFMQKYNIQDPVAAIELYGKTEWLTKSQLKSAKSTMKERFFNTPEDLINADDETINQKILSDLQSQGIL